MSHVLQQFFHDLTPLQQAAYDRIIAYKKELAQEYGLHVRSAMELEFVTEGLDGKPLNTAIIRKGDPAVHLLRNALFSDSPAEKDYIEKLTYESMELSMPLVPYQYEVNITEAIKAENSASFAPENVAGITSLLSGAKGGGNKLEEYLKSSTALTWPGSLGGLNFHPRPYRTAVPRDFPGAENADEVTSALHVNVSLYDKNGINQFAQSRDLWDHCANALAELQNEAGLTMLPSADSLTRIDNDGTLSSPIGIGVRHEEKDSRGKYYNSINLREYSQYSPIRKSHARIENRLPGADVDPLVAMAVTMAALVDAVRRHVHKGADGKIERIDPAPEEHPKYEIPKAHEKIIEQFEASAHARELLGDALYENILKEYAPEHAAVMAL